MEDATKLLWIEYWASNVDPKYNYAVIQEEKQKDGTWLVEAKVPFYNKVVSNKSEKLIDAVLSVANEACEIIEKLIADNPNLYVQNKYVDGHWKIIVDSDGEGYSITQSDEYFKETQEIQKCLTEALSNQSEAILHTIKRWLGSTELAFLHIFDKRMFGNENKEIMKNIRILIKKLHKENVSAARTYICGDSVISFGYKMKIE